MNRRRVLALLGSAAVGGCLGGESRGQTTTRHTTAQHTTTRHTTTETTTATTAKETREKPTETTETATPEPPELGEPLPSDCPVFGGAQRVVCYPGAEAPLSMTPSADTVSLPDASLSFTLENDTDATFETNFYAWRLHKRVEGEWYYVAPEMWPEPLHRLSASESHAWNVTIDDAPPECEATCSSSDRNVTLRGLGGGTYAFGVAGTFAGQHYTDQTAVVAQFTVEGDSVSLSRTDSVESVERNDDGVVVRMPDNSDTEKTVTVTRTDESSADSTRVITEQVLRHTPLRNALASFEDGVEVVRVENAQPTVGPIVYADGKRSVKYEGETYRVEQADETTST